jgi:cytoskeletal protein RodZ
MSKTDKMSSYGLYLQTVRVEKGISIETVAAETRIRADILRAIEAEDHQHLPDDVFVKGFLKSFADAIGADADETLRRFAVRRSVQPAPQIQLGETVAPQGSSWLTLLWIAVLMIALVGATLLVYELIHSKKAGETPQTAPPAASEARSEEEPAPPAPSATEPLTPSVPPAAEPALPESATGQEAAADSEEALPAASPGQKTGGYLLEVVCEEDTWLKVIADDAPATEHLLKPGDTIRLKADSKFNLLIGNAGGVSVQLNGQPVPVPGGSGEVVNLELP